METLAKLKDQGWHLTEEGLKKLSAASGAEEVTDVRKIITAALDWDFRDIAGGALPPVKREDVLPGKIVLQLQKVRNISAPKSNEESKTAPRFLQLELTDGQTTLQALELEPISSLSLNLAPGTKLSFTAQRLQLLQGFLVLRASEVQVLGGRVEALAEKWELARTMQKYARSGRRISGASGPPPWVAFGKRTDAKDSGLANDRNFKSLQAVLEKEQGKEKDKDSKENNEFNAMRSEAIAVAAKAGAKKVFGGGGQQILDHNLKKILEKGYDEEDAKLALRTTNNNLERALHNLKRRQDFRRQDEEVPMQDTRRDSKPMRGMGGGGRGGRRDGGASLKDEANAAKPAGNVSLFDFLTDKFPANADGTASDAATTATTAAPHAHAAEGARSDRGRSEAFKASHDPNSGRPRFENNISSSFAANRTPRGGGGRGSGRGDRGDRETYNGERGANSRFASGSGGGARGGRGGGRGGGQKPSYEESHTSGRGEGRGGTSGRNNRSSHERAANATTPATAGDRDRERDREENRSGRRRNDFQREETRPREGGNRNQGQTNSSVGGSNKTKAKPTESGKGSGHTHNNNSSSTSNNKDGVNKLIESTSKLRIDKNRDSTRPQQQQQQQASSQQPQVAQRSQAPPPFMTAAAAAAPPTPAQFNAFAQLPNGLPYDPSKIIGFQSKETNEFAMSLLKSQGFMDQQQQQQQQDQLQQQQQQAMHGFVEVNPTYIMASPPPPPPPQLSPLMTHQFGMMPTEPWVWQVGDLCRAKYWDDGRYYEAEVTAVADKTCVVFFLGYGNHEEVLKTDCLPFTDANFRPINNFTNPPPPQYQQQQQQQQQQLLQQQQPPLMQEPPMAEQQFGDVGNTSFPRGGGRSRRFRTERPERQMLYVPPNKRGPRS